MTVKAIACLLACQIAVPSTPTMAGDSKPGKERRRWIDATLVGVDRAHRHVSYRVGQGEVNTSGIGSDAALRKLGELEIGHEVKLKCHEASDGTVVVEDAKKPKSGLDRWFHGFLWAVGILAVAGVVWVILLYTAAD